MKSSAERLVILVDTFQLYADNDPKHSSAVAREWTLYNCPKVIQTPAYSPDLNIIEHVWNELEVQICQHEITNKEKLKRVLAKEWKKIDPAYLENLVKSMPRCIG